MFNKIYNLSTQYCQNISLKPMLFLKLWQKVILCISQSQLPEFVKRKGHGYYQSGTQLVYYI